MPLEGRVMISGSVVFYKIATTCLLIFVGFLARRMKLLPEISVSVLSKYIMYFALPAYIVYYMPSTVSMETLSTNWFFPLVGVAVFMVGDVFAYITAKLWAKPRDLATFRHLVGIPNWVFMALAVCEPMFGGDGVRIVLLYNISMMFYFWSFGMSSYRVGGDRKKMLRQLFCNVQTLANVIGLIFALLLPFVRGMESMDSGELSALPPYLGVVTPFWETIYLIGMTALPLSIFQVGLVLGETDGENGTVAIRDDRALCLAVLLRLVVSPLMSIALLMLLCELGVPLTMNEFVISAIIMAMPAAVLCITSAEVYGGNTVLAARGVLWGTLASLLTAPVVTWLAVWAYTFI